MIKKLKYIALATVAVALSSCSSTDEPNANPSLEDCISFSQPTVNLQATLSDFADNLGTRAEIPSWTKIDKFQVWGFCVPNNVKIEDGQNKNGASQEWNDKSTFFTSDNCGDVFHGITVVDTGDGFTSYDKDNRNPALKNYKRWSDVSDKAEALYTFIAGYVPDGLGSFKMAKGYQTTQTDADGKNLSYGPKLSFTINRTSTDTTKTTIDPKGQPDALVAAKYDHKKSNVGLSFFHFMTGIRFQFHNYTSNKSLVIRKVTYKGDFHKTATFDFTTDKPSMSVSDSYAGKFLLFEGEQTISPGTAAYMSEADGAAPITLLLLPDPSGTTDQDEHFTLGKNKQIQIEYTIGGINRTFTYGKNFTLNYTPLPNTLHTAHFNFIGDEFVVMFQADDVKNWQNGSDNNVTIK